MQTPHETRYFVSYSGVKLPLKFVNPIEQSETENRNTYFCGFYDQEGKMVGCEKRVYGEIEFSHVYDYYPCGALKSASITLLDDAPQHINFPDPSA